VARKKDKIASDVVAVIEFRFRNGDVLHEHYTDFDRAKTTMDGLVNAHNDIYYPTMINGLKPLSAVPPNVPEGVKITEDMIGRPYRTLVVERTHAAVGEKGVQNINYKAASIRMEEVAAIVFVPIRLPGDPEPNIYGEEDDE